MTIKRFILFGGEDYEMGGGLCDFIDSFDTEHEAVAAAVAIQPMQTETGWNIDWWQVFDTVARRCTASNCRDQGGSVWVVDMKPCGDKFTTPASVGRRPWPAPLFYGPPEVETPR